MPFTSAQLATEINTDPKALGYAAFVSAHDRAGLAAKLNATYAGVGTVYRNDLKSLEIVGAIVNADVTGFTAAQWARVQVLIAPPVIDASNANVRGQFTGIFSGTSLTNLDTVAKKANPSRAEELWGYKTLITDQDIANAGFN